jgi:hypothetical protein
MHRGHAEEDKESGRLYVRGECRSKREQGMCRGWWRVLRARGDPTSRVNR